MKIASLYPAIGALVASSSCLAFAAGEPAMPIMSTLVSLIIVLAVIAVAAFVVKRVAPGHAPQSRMMHVVSQLPLGAREKISVVEIGDQWLVLGVTANQVTLLTQTPKQESTPTPPSAVSFSKLLDFARGRHDAK
jgi:flagellar protein FliO/FliZ